MSAPRRPIPRRACTWHDAECGGYARGPAALGAAGRASAAGRCSTSAPGRDGSPCISPARGHEVVAVDADPDLLDAPCASGPRSAALDVETVEADVRELDLGRRPSR